MSKFTKSLIGIAAGAALASVTGCSTGGSGYGAVNSDAGLVALGSATALGDPGTLLYAGDETSDYLCTDCGVSVMNLAQAKVHTASCPAFESSDTSLARR